jgi:hypothetical protein
MCYVAVELHNVKMSRTMEGISLQKSSTINEISSNRANKTQKTTQNFSEPERIPSKIIQVYDIDISPSNKRLTRICAIHKKNSACWRRKNCEKFKQP